MRLAGLAALGSSFAMPLLAAEPDLRDLLRDALYTEEVNRDPDTAAQQYENLLDRLDDQRAFAATAIFRLAEVRRKQGRKDEAVQLYQRLIREFPAAGPEVKLATENLAALGGKVPETGDTASDEETKELLRLQNLAATNPDKLRDPKNMEGAAQRGWMKVVKYLVDQGLDPYQSSALAGAVQNGYLNVCKGILELKGPPPPEMADFALEQALHSKNREVLKFLLSSKGFDPKRIPALAISVNVPRHEWDREVTELLLKAGAELDTMPAKTMVNREGTSPRGTALHEAIARENVDAANYLLDQGAKPDLPTPDYNVTPLHYAVSTEDPAMLPIVKRLLAAGADPSREVTWHNSGGMPGWDRATPLEMAVVHENKAVVELLLAAKADVKREKLLMKVAQGGNTEILALLLDAGLDPNAYTYPNPNGSGEVPVIDALVTRFRQPQSINARQVSMVPVLELLLDRGAKPSPAMISSRFSQVDSQFIGLLVRRFIYADLSARAAITAIFPRQGNYNPDLVLAEKVGESVPPQFASFHGKLVAAYNNSNEITALLKATILRRQEGGSYKEIPVDVAQDAPLPALEWGDIIEFGQTQGGLSTSDTGRIYWLYRRHLSAAVSVEIGGEKKRYRLEGKRLAFDVTRDEVPWSTAGQLVSRLWSTPLDENDLKGTGVAIVVGRKDWPPLRMPYPSEEASKFSLQEGDELKLEIPAEVETKIRESRKNHVAVRAPGHPYQIFFPPSRVEGAPPVEPPLLPTLAQLLAEIYGGSRAEVEAESVKDPKILGNLATYQDFPISYSVLPYPDFGKIRIVRLREDGTEETLSLDWLAAIAAVKADSAAEEFKKLDVVLQAGDIVELQMKKDRPAEEWHGFSPQEELLLAKMLEGKVQRIDEDGRISLVPLTYKAPVYVNTEAGYLPTLPAGGSPSMRLTRVMRGIRSNQEWVDITRGAATSSSLPKWEIFLRDGDVVRENSELRQAPPSPGVIPGVVPPPEQ